MFNSNRNSVIMKKTVPLALLILTFLICGCSDKGTDSDIAGNLNTEFQLALGSSAVIEQTQLQVEFTAVDFDHRCGTPLELCLWEGMAIISMNLTHHGDEGIFNLAISGNPTESSIRLLAIDTLGYRFELTDLTPHPGDPQPLNNPFPLPYTAAIRISQADGQSLDPVVITDLTPEEINVDKFTLLNADINGNTLIGDFQYAGGCRPHFVFAYMSPPAFLESYPVQANIYFRHIANGDMCEALLTEDYRLNLAPIVELHRQEYGTNGPIILNLFEYTDSGIVKKLSLTLN